MVLRWLISLFIVFTLFSPLSKASDKNEINWINQYRLKYDLSLLKPDSLLMQNALDYAREIVKTGEFSHKNTQGQRALGRYLAAGGSESEVGEILGIGPNANSIINSWKNSYSHREVLKKERWTHFGEGKYIIDNKLIYVILFIQKHAKEINFGWRIKKSNWFIKGVWCDSKQKPELLNGTKKEPCFVWDNKTGNFEFLIPASRLSSYLRLGYRDPKKGFQITHLFYPYKQN